MAEYKTEKIAGAPGIFKLLRDGEWVSTRIVYRDGGGKQVVKTIHGPNTLTAAKQWKAANVRFRDTSGRPDVAAGKIALRAVYDEMVDEAQSQGKAYAPATLELHSFVWRTLSKVDPKLPETEIGKITPARVTRTLAQVEAREVRSKARALLQRVGNYALAHGYIQTQFIEKEFSPRTRAARKQPETKPERMPSTDEVGRLAAAVPERYRVLILVMAFEGLRPGEAFGLKIGDLDFKAGTITVRRSLSNGREGETKTGQKRTIPMIPAPGMRDSLEAHLERFGSEDPGSFIFTTEAGKPVESQNWRQKTFATAARAAGVNNGISPNQLRHHAASFWIARGANVLQVSRLLGHAKPSITLDVYSALFSDDLLRLATVPAELPALPATSRA